MSTTPIIDARLVFRNMMATIQRQPLPPTPARRQVLLACMPKSGSTFLAAILARLPGMGTAHLVTGFDRREQELAVEQMLMLRSVDYVAQHHIRHSQPTEWLIDHFGLKTVVLVRDLFDCAVSNRDHFLKLRQFEGSMAWADATLLDWPPERVTDFVIDHLMPWCVHFHVGWTQAGRFPIVTYDALAADPAGTVAAICDRLDIPVDRDAIDSAVAGAQSAPTLRNVARPGRGRSELTPGQQDRLRRLCSYYPQVDFAPVGLGP